VSIALRGGVIRPRTRHQIGLAELLGVRVAVSDPLISGITIDSRLVRPGDLYVALSGAHHHGAEFAQQAAAAGAVAILTDTAGSLLAQEVSLLGGWLGDGLPSWGKVKTHLDRVSPF